MWPRFKFNIKIILNFKNMAEISRGEIEKVQELRSRLRTFWENVLEKYFEQHHEYPPLVDGKRVNQFINLVSNRDPNFRQSIGQFRPIQGDIERVAMEVYNELIGEKK